MPQRPHWLQWDASHLPQHCSFSFDDLHLHLIHPFLDRPNSPPQTTSRFTQPFFHSTLSGPTDREIDKSYGTMRHVRSGKNTRILSLWHRKYGRYGSKKAYTGPTKFGCDRSIVVGCRSRNDRQTNRME